MMMSPNDELIAYVLGAQDEAGKEAVRRRLARDPEWRHQLTELRRQLRRLEALSGEHEPPPGLAERTCDYVFSQAAHLAQAEEELEVVAPPPVAPPVTRRPQTATWGVKPAAPRRRFSWRLTRLESALAVAVLCVAAIGFWPAIWQASSGSAITGTTAPPGSTVVCATGQSERFERPLAPSTLGRTPRFGDLLCSGPAPCPVNGRQPMFDPYGRGRLGFGAPHIAAYPPDFTAPSRSTVNDIERQLPMLGGRYGLDPHSTLAWPQGRTPLDVVNADSVPVERGWVAKPPRLAPDSTPRMFAAPLALRLLTDAAPSPAVAVDDDDSLTSAEAAQ